MFCWLLFNPKLSFFPFFIPSFCVCVCAGGIEHKLVMVGLDNAGKTTILYQFLMNEVVHTSPTIGSNVEEIVWKNIHFLVWDLAGKCSMLSTTYYRILVRNLWNGRIHPIHTVGSVSRKLLHTLVFLSSTVFIDHAAVNVTVEKFVDNNSNKPFIVFFRSSNQVNKVYGRRGVHITRIQR